MDAPGTIGVYPGTHRYVQYDTVSLCGARTKGDGRGLVVRLHGARVLSGSTRKRAGRLYRVDGTFLLVGFVRSIHDRCGRQTPGEPTDARGRVAELHAHA